MQTLVDRMAIADSTNSAMAWHRVELAAKGIKEMRATLNTALSQELNRKLMTRLQMVNKSTHGTAPPNILQHALVRQLSYIAMVLVPRCMCAF